ncbi:MAG: hypothetical protein ACR5LF_03325 [Symbiopectobacterium sp.]
MRIWSAIFTSTCVQTPICFADDRIGARRTLVAGLTRGSLALCRLG